jgi:hypothetical protein
MNATARPRVRFCFNAHVRALLLVLAVLIGLVQPAAAIPEPPYLGPPAGFTSIDTNHLRLIVQQEAAVLPTAFAVAYGPYLDRAYEELTALFPAPPLRPELYVYATEANLEAAMTMAGPTPVAVVDSGAGEIALALPRLQRLSTLEAENTLRHALGRLVARRAAGGNLPPGLEEGIALYIERPISARIARYAALLQNANRQNELIRWDILYPGATAIEDQDAALAEASAYGVVAFLADRYGLHRLNQFVTTLRDQPDWRLALREVYQRPLSEIETEWRDQLPQWTATGWQTNLFAAFDLQLARDLLANAHYAAAKEEIGKSLRLATELRDPVRLAEAEALLRQSDIGLQAESLMAQIQKALEGHDYGRAQELIGQARGQFAQLPATQSMDELLASYQRLAEQGALATSALEAARILAPSWADYPEARAAALEAGVTAANLGDQAVTDQARAILSEIDARQRRIVFLLLALAAMTFAWLGLWRWSRGGAELDWR